MEAVKLFSGQMRTMGERLAQAKIFYDYRYARERCFLGAAEIYGEAVEGLARNLSTAEIKSRGLRAFRELTSSSFCTSLIERVYITAMGCETGLGGIRGLQAAGAGGL